MTDTDNEKQTARETRRRKNLFGEIFPREYDFECMLSQQSEMTVLGMQTFVRWLETQQPFDVSELQRIETEVDGSRHDLEEKLIRSFSTPFDRQDIYSISRQMDYILNYTNETAKEMQAFGVDPDKTIQDMATHLLGGTKHISNGIQRITSDKDTVEAEIRQARSAYHRLEGEYIAGMTELFKTGDAMNALKKREIYHHLRDAGRALRNTIDILHNAVIDLA